MKKAHYIILLAFFSCSFFNYSVYATQKKVFTGLSPTDTLLTALQSINLSLYAGKPVDSLLNHLPAGVIDMQITGWRSIRRAEILHVIYPNKVVVEIHVKNFQFMNPEWVNTATPTQNWSVTLFRKETVTHTVIFNGTVCINGCENEYK